MNRKALFTGALLVFVVAAHAASGTAPRASNATPLHHYTFDGPAVADSVGSAAGALLNGAVSGGGVLSLDGVGAFVEFNQPLIPTTGAFSVAFFAQELTPTSDRAELISQGRWFGPGFYIGYYPPSSNVRIGDEWQGTGLRFPQDRHWHHYALTVTEKASRFYLDGALAATSQPIHIAADGNNTRLGRQYDPWPEYFHGSFAEFWIYDGALTAREVKALASVEGKLAPASENRLGRVATLARLVGGSGKSAAILLLWLAALVVTGLLLLFFIFAPRWRRKRRSAQIPLKKF